MISERQGHALPAQGVRILLCADLIRLALQQILAGHVQQPGLVLAGTLEPTFEAGQLVDILWNPLIEKPVQGLVINQDVTLARLGLQRIQFLQQGLVGTLEGRPPVPLSFHQRMADKQLAGDHRVDRAEMHLAPRHYDQPVQRDLLEGHHLAALLFPMGLAVTGLGQVAGQGLHPQRVDLRHQAAIEPPGFGQFGNHHPGRPLLRQRRGGMQHEPALARTEIIALLGLVTQMAQQTSQQRLVHGVITSRLGIALQAQIPAGKQQLSMGFAPLAHAQVIEELPPTPAAQLVLRQLLALLLEAPPQVDESSEVGLIIAPLNMGLICRLLALNRAFPRVLHGQGTGDDQHFLQAAKYRGLDQHPADARVHRQTRQLASDLGNTAIALDRPQLLEQIETVTDGPAIRWFDKGKVLDPPQAQVQHLQNHRRQVGPQDLRVGEFRTTEKIRLVIQPHADARRHAAATALALVGAGLGHRLDR